ncbi:MAG: hypothetical protein DHS20C01_27860 [marine bacterium B5-7]|nr:MAG: hypothetical protein DHS20C01_27860 [marine bacterium B5-7]
MTPGKYTELFFLDEATALAAGHRPCAECRRQDYNRFKQMWIQGNSDLPAGAGSEITKIDSILHSERIDSNKRKPIWTAALNNLPDGVFIAYPNTTQPLLLHNRRLFDWSPGGYEKSIHTPSFELQVVVLTPRSIVKTISVGYQPQLHESITINK